MNQILINKYGDQYGQVLDSNTFPEKVKQDYSELVVGALYKTMLNFERIESTHRMLMEHVFHNHFAYL